MADTKKTIFMVLGGCGCLLAIGGIIFLAMIFMGVGMVESTLERNGLGGISEVRETLESFGTPTPEAQPEAMKEVNSIRDKMDPDNVDAEVISAETRKAFTEQDRAEFVALIEHLESTDAFEDAASQLEALKKKSGGPSAEEKGVLEQLGDMKSAVDTYQAARDLIVEFDTEVKRTGGYPEYYGRLTRIAGVLAAAKSNAVDEDPTSDATAKRLLELQPKVAAEVAEIDTKLEELSAADDAAKAQQAQQIGLGAYMKPDQVALGTFPKESFENWADLSVKERAELLELHDRKEGVWGVMAAGNLTRGDAFVMLSGMKKLDRFKDASKK